MVCSSSSTVCSASSTVYLASSTVSFFFPLTRWWLSVTTVTCTYLPGTAFGVSCSAMQAQQVEGSSLPEGAFLIPSGSWYAEGPLSIYLSVYLSIYIYISIYLSMYLCIYLSIYLYVYLPIYLSIYWCIYIFIYIYFEVSISVYLSIYLSIYLYKCLSIYLSIYQVPVYLAGTYCFGGVQNHATMSHCCRPYFIWRTW